MPRKNTEEIKKPQLGAVVSKELYERFTKVAAREHRSNSEQLRYIVEKYLDEYEKNNP